MPTNKAKFTSPFPLLNCKWVSRSSWLWSSYCRHKQLCLSGIQLVISVTVYFMAVSPEIQKYNKLFICQAFSVVFQPLLSPFPGLSLVEAGVKSFEQGHQRTTASLFLTQAYKEIVIKANNTCQCCPVIVLGFVVLLGYNFSPYGAPGEFCFLCCWIWSAQWKTCHRTESFASCELRGRHDWKSSSSAS